MKRMLAAAGAFGLLLAVPGAQAAIAASAELGGFTVRAAASPVTVQVWDEVIPIPNEPQGEANFSYTRATMDTGPTTRALASSVWPGDTFGDGWGVVTGQEGEEWPIRSNATYPGGQQENAQELAPGVGMSTKADENLATAFAQLKAGAGAPEDAAVLATARLVSSTSRVVNGDSKVTSVADAAATDLELLGGLIKIAGLHVVSTSTSDGDEGSTDGQVTITGLTVQDVPIKVSDGGVDFADQNSGELPKQPAEVAALLDQLGIVIEPLRVSRTTEGPSAAQHATGLVISIDTTPLRQAMDAPLSAIRDGMPEEMRSEMASLFEASPRIVYLIGNVSSAASASPEFVFTPPPLGSLTDPPFEAGVGAGPVGTAEDVGIGEAPVGEVAPAPEVAVPGPAVVAQPVASFGGIPASLLAGALLAAAFIGLGVRQLGAAMLGAAFGACDLGAANGVPNLREG